MSDHEISVQFAHCPLFRTRKRIDNSRRLIVWIFHSRSDRDFYFFSLSLSLFFPSRPNFRSPGRAGCRGSTRRNLSWREEVHLSLRPNRSDRVIVLPCITCFQSFLTLSIFLSFFFVCDSPLSTCLSTIIRNLPTRTLCTFSVIFHRFIPLLSRARDYFTRSIQSRAPQWNFHRLSPINANQVNRYNSNCAIIT